MNAALVLTDEPVQDIPRHPWTCSWRNPKGSTCGGKNRAMDLHCCKCGRPYAPSVRGVWDPGKGLAENVTLSQAIDEFQDIALHIRSLFEQFHAIEKRLGILFVDQSGATEGEVRTMKVRLRSSHYEGIDFTRADDAIEAIERDIWGVIVERSGVYRMTSDKRAREVREQLEKGELPTITRANVAAWITNIQGTADELLREKITEVFNWLRPHSSYKTNSPFELGRKVVLEYIVERADPRWTWRVTVNHNRRQILASMETLFKTLDGQGGSTSEWKSDLQKAIEASSPEDSRGETNYFCFRAFRNGNMHLEFKRIDLVTKLNAIAGGKNLKGNRKSGSN